MLRFAQARTWTGAVGTSFSRRLIKDSLPLQVASAASGDSGSANQAAYFLAVGGCAAALGLLHSQLHPLKAESHPGHSNATLTCFGEAMLRYIPDPNPKPDKTSIFTSQWLKNAGGAELNVTISLSRLGWGDKARWVSVVPKGPLGDELLQLAREAYVDGKGEGNLSLVRREEGDVGIYHVWPLKKQVWYQRYNSVFGLMNPDWFSDKFWMGVLSQTAAPPKAGNQHPPHVLLVTGITPQISADAHKAWWRALRAARVLRHESLRDKSKPRIVCVMDFNHRPNLGTMDDLWMMVEQHLRTTDLFMMSVGNLPGIADLLNVPQGDPFKSSQIPKGIAGADALDAAVARSLRALQEHLGHKTAIGVCLKCVKEEKLAPGQLPAQLRWSMICLKNGEIVSTLPSAIEHRPIEPIGGGDSWLSGIIDGLVGTAAPAAAAPEWPKEMWVAAMQRGDMLAKMKQDCIGDFSNVTKDELDAALKTHKSQAAFACRSK
jgi:sugar/nucleoside kinase (ribokinase family)